LNCHVYLGKFPRGRNCPFEGPYFNFLDLFGHGDGEWNRPADHYHQILLGHRTPVGERFEDCGVDRLFDFRAGKTSGRAGQETDVEGARSICRFARWMRNMSSRAGASGNPT
jgi:hypothetical protein